MGALVIGAVATAIAHARPTGALYVHHCVVPQEHKTHACSIQVMQQPRLGLILLAPTAAVPSRLLQPAPGRRLHGSQYASNHMTRTCPIMCCHVRPRSKAAPCRRAGRLPSHQRGARSLPTLLMVIRHS